MKIAILCPTFYTFQGVSRLAWQEAEDLARDNEVTVFALEANMDPPAGVKMKILGMPHAFFAQRVYRLLFPLDFIKISKWVPMLKGFDEIYAYEYPLTWLAYFARGRYGAKYIFYNTHFNPPQAFSSRLEQTYVRLRFAMEKWALKRADAAISISQFSRKQLKELVGLDSEVKYIRIDRNRFHPGLDGSSIRKQYRLGNSPVVLYVGHISPNKGVHLLIEAFNSAKREIPDARLIIVGKQHYPDYYKKLASMTDDAVIFTGDVPDRDLSLYYAACDLYATGTRWEGFDMPLAEAQACGKPVVAFDIGPHPEVVDTNNMGILVPDSDVKAMAEAIVKFLKDSETANR